MARKSPARRTPSRPVQAKAPVPELTPPGGQDVPQHFLAEDWKQVRPLTRDEAELLLAMLMNPQICSMFQTPAAKRDAAGAQEALGA